MRLPATDLGRLAPVTFAALAAIPFAPGLFFGQVPIYRDLLVLFLPLRSYAASAIRSGRLPLWNPDLFFGAPFLANYQSAVLYPPSVILYLVPLPAGVSLYLAFHIAVAGWGMARFLERRCGCEPMAASFGGIVFAFGGFLSSLISLPNQLQVAAWLPWVLEAGEELAQGVAFRPFSRLTLFLTLQLLGGGPEALLLTLALLTARLLRAAVKGCARATAVPALFAAPLVALTLSAVQILPTIEYISRTDRAEALSYTTVAAESLEPASFLQLALPHVFVDGAPGFIPERGVPLFWSIYEGVAPIALVASAVLLGGAGFWLAILVVATALALGSNLPLLGFLYDAWPALVGAFRFPGKFFLLAHFSLAVLAGQGLSAALAARIPRVAGIFVAAALAAFGVVVSFLAWTSPETLLRDLGYNLRFGLPAGTYALIGLQVAGTAFRTAALGVATVVVMTLAGQKRLATTAPALVLAALAYTDLVMIHQPSFVFTDWRSLVASAEPARFGIGNGERIFHYCLDRFGCLPEGAAGLAPWSGSIRIAEPVAPRARSLWASLIPDAPLVYGAATVSGTDGLATRERRDFYQALALLPRPQAAKMLASLGVDRLIGPEPLNVDGLREIMQSADPPFWAYEVAPRAPRAYVAERVLFAPDVGSAFLRLAQPDFRPGRDAVIVGQETVAETGTSGAIEETRFEQERLSVRLTTSGPSLLVISDTWFPGWEARIDNAPAAILRVNGALRGVRVSGGQHRVEMHYDPVSFRRGLAVSATALLALVIVGLVAMRRSRSLSPAARAG